MGNCAKTFADDIRDEVIGNGAEALLNPEGVCQAGGCKPKSIAFEEWCLARKDRWTYWDDFMGNCIQNCYVVGDFFGEDGYPIFKQECEAHGGIASETGARNQFNCDFHRNKQ